MSNPCNLPGPNPFVVEIIELMDVVRDVRIGHDREFTEQHGAHDEVWLSAQQFLVLMAWGEENREQIERLAQAKEKRSV